MLRSRTLRHPALSPEAAEAGPVPSASFQFPALVRRHGFALGLVLLVLFKLWLVHTEEIYGSSTEYDALWYVGSAKHWYWGATYRWTAFVRPCAYPLFIAVLHFCGIPLRLGIEFAQMGGFLVLIAALRKGGVPRVLCLVIFGLMIVHPACLRYNNHSMSDSFYTAVLPIALGGMLLTLFTRRYLHALWTGIALAVLWNTREESFLIPVIIAAFLGLAFLQKRLPVQTWKGHISFWSKRIGAMVGSLGLIVALVYSANYLTFRSFAKSDMSSPAYQAAFKALLRIKPSHVRRYISVSSEAVQMAYQVSPTFARLKPHFEGITGRNWQNPARDTIHLDEWGPWFMWAFRNVTSEAGFYKDPVATNNFYLEAAREINLACDEGRIPSRFVLTGFLDPGAVSRIRYVPRCVPDIARLFLLRYEKSPVRDDTNCFPWMCSLYEEMCFRRPRVGTSNEPLTPDTLSAAVAIRTQKIIGDNYRFLVIALSIAALIAFLAMAGLFRRFRISDPINAILLLLAATIVSRILFFAFLEATWWMDGYDRYMFPVMPLSTGYFLILLYQTVALWRRRPIA